MKKIIILVFISTASLALILTGCFDQSSNSTTSSPTTIAYHYDCNFTEPFLTLKFTPATSTIVKMAPDPQTGSVVTHHFVATHGSFTNSAGHSIIVATPHDLNEATLYITDDGTPGSDGMSDTHYTYHGKTSYVVPVSSPLTATIIHGGCNKINSPVVEAASDAASS